MPPYDVQISGYVSKANAVRNFIPWKWFASGGLLPRNRAHQGCFMKHGWKRLRPSLGNHDSNIAVAQNVEAGSCPLKRICEDDKQEKTARAAAREFSARLIQSSLAAKKLSESRTKAERAPFSWGEGRLEIFERADHARNSLMPVSTAGVRGVNGWATAAHLRSPPGLSPAPFMENQRWCGGPRKPPAPQPQEAARGQRCGVLDYSLGVKVRGVR